MDSGLEGMKGQLYLKSPYCNHRSANEEVLVGCWSTSDWVRGNLTRKALSKRAAVDIFRSVNAPDCECRTEKVRDLGLPQQDRSSLPAAISQHVQLGQFRQALKLYQDMRDGGVKASSYTFVAALRACSKSKDLVSARKLHADVVESGLESIIFVQNTLVDVYAKCGSLVDARSVFNKMLLRDVVSWNAMISGYAQMGEGNEALQLYAQMQQEGVAPDDRSFVAALKACSTLAVMKEEDNVCGQRLNKRCLELVRAIHIDVVKNGSESAVFVGTMLVDVYARCGSLVDARFVFNNMPTRNVVSWNAMISGYAQMGEGKEAFHLYARMQHEGVVPNDRTYVATLKACSCLAAVEDRGEVPGKFLKKMCLQQVRTIHSDILRGGFESDIFVGNMLVDLYAKCGNLASARLVFEKMPHRSIVSWTALILGYAQVEEGDVALQLFAQMQHEQVVMDARAYIGALKACSSLAAVEEGFKINGKCLKKRCLERVKAIHSDALNKGFESDVFVANTLVDVYAKCGSLLDARCMFEKMLRHDVVSWNAMILGYAQLDEGEEALRLYARMQQEGVQPNDGTFVGALKACGSSLFALNEGEKCDSEHLKEERLQRVKAIHFDIVKNGSQCDVFVGNMLVDAYAKCWALEDARRVFEEMPHRDVVSWNTMILGYADMKEGEEALQLYTHMQYEGLVPDICTFVGALKACITMTAVKQTQGDGTSENNTCLEQVRAIHSTIVERQFELNVFVGTMLVDAYAKCGSLVDARWIFERMLCRDIVSWNAMIFGYAQKEDCEEALQLYARMQQEGMVPNQQTFLSALKACSSLVASKEASQGAGRGVQQGCLEQVRDIHSDVVNGEFKSDVLVANMLVYVYAKCRSLVDARNVFESIPHRDVVSWTAIIFGYAQMEEGEVALQLYSRMQQEGLLPNERTYVGALKACSSLAGSVHAKEAEMDHLKKRYLDEVRAIHNHIVSSGFKLTLFVGTMLVDAYAKCESLGDARCVFDKMPHRDVGCWNAMILGYAHMEEAEEALQLYTQMQPEDVVRDDRTFVGALKACCTLVGLKEGNVCDTTVVKSWCLDQVRAIHLDILKAKVGLDVFLGTMLVDVYMKCGSPEDARHVFERMPHRDVASWNAMILGNVRNNDGEAALKLYASMQQEGLLPNNRTFVGALKACGAVAGLEKGKEIHAQVSKIGLEDSDVFVASSLIDMYSKCGSMVDACQVFDALFTKDIVTWNALIAGYARQGESELVVDLFERMKQGGTRPDGTTLLSILTVCSHAGLVQKGQIYFDAMTTEYGITPTIEHYTCMIDLLGRAGHLDKAMSVIRTMPFQPDSAVWETVLGASRKWSNLELGRMAFECAVRLDQNDAAAYVLMSNIYEAAQMGEDAKEIQALRVKTKAQKQRGQSWWTDVGGIVHTFGVGDRKHSETEHVHSKLCVLLSKMEEERAHLDKAPTNCTKRSTN